MKNSDSPPRHLSAAARTIWKRLTEDYVLEDGAGLALLRAACESFDRGEEARKLIAKEGAVITDRFGQRKAHPACAVERDARAAMVSALRALRLEPES